MTTEKDITDLAARLKAAYPQRHTAVSMAIDNYAASGRTEMSYWAYLGVKETPARPSISPDFPTFPELAAWVEANWLNKEQS